MNPTAKEILEMARNMPLLTTELVKRIESVLPKMNEEQLENLRTKLNKVTEEGVALLDRQLELISLGEGASEAQLKNDERDEREAAEKASHDQDLADAESLIDSL